MVRCLTKKLGSAILLLWIAGALSAFAETRQIVVLYDERIDLPGLALLNTGLNHVLASGSPDRVEIYREEMNLSRFDSPRYRDLLRDQFREKYAAKKIDVVVTVMAPALDFLLSQRDEIFPGIPVVFCGLDRKQLSDRSLPADVTGVLVKREFAPTLDLVARLHPDTEQIMVVAGTSNFDERLLAQAREEFKPFEKRFAFTYLTNLPLPELVSRLSQLPSKTVILYTTMFRDGAGQPQVTHDVVERISAAANAPVYGFLDQYVGYGIVGGWVYGFGAHAEEAAGLALKILSGRKPEQLSPIEPANNVMLFDERQLQRWKIDVDRLPPGSTVLFRQQTIWQQYKGWIIGGASALALQAVLIFGLLANLIRRRRAEGSLVESEQRFQNAADAAPVLMWMTGPDKRALFYNKEWLNFTGRTMERELGDGWTDVVHEDDLENTLQRFQTAFDAREPFVIQNRLRRHDGEFRWMTASGAPRHDGKGKFLGYIGASIDVTDLLKKEEALHESEERIALAAEAAHLGVWELNLATNELWVSDQWRALFQVEPGVPVALDDACEFIHPDDRDRRTAAVRKAIEESGGYEIEYRSIFPDKTLHWIAGRARCLPGEQGLPRRLLGVSADVTDRKQAEELFRFATEASPSGTVLMNAEGRVVLVNAHIEELFNYERNELIDQPIEILIPDRFRTAFTAQRASFLAAPQVRVMGAGLELFGRRKDGSEFPIEIGINPIESPQGFLILATVADISARKAAEEEAHHRREQIELLGRVSLLGEMTASLAHELNQPLYAILNNANAGMRFIDKGKVDPVQLREILGDVLADGRRAHDIVQNVRNSIKKGSSVRQPMDLNEVVKKVTHMVHPEAAAHSCEMHLSLAKKLPSVEGDPTQMEQVLINLVNNALDAMRDTPPGLRRVQITTESNGDGKVYVAVRDHGVGIAEGNREQLFEHFFTTKEEGLGMGLAIVRSIVEAHGGLIDVENAKGGGARFYFSLPANEGTPV